MKPLDLEAIEAKAKAGPITVTQQENVAALIGEVRELRKLLGLMYKYLAHADTCHPEGPCTCGLLELLRDMGRREKSWKT